MITNEKRNIKTKNPKSLRIYAIPYSTRNV